MLKKFIYTFAVIMIGVFINDSIISNSTQLQTYSLVNDIPAKKVGLVLGTSKYISNGQDNLFYIYRLNAAKELFENQKVEFLILSGDNSTNQYNEPQTMKTDLIELGIPEEKIFLDYAGFRTLDSVIRAKEIFSEDDFTIISQEFHNQRALFIANFNNINAIAFNAKDVPIKKSFRVYIREKFARVKTALDLITGVPPKFLGDKISIN